MLFEQEKQTQQAVLECAELRAQVFALRSENSQALGEVRSKEEQIHQLSRDLHNLVCYIIVLAYKKYVGPSLKPVEYRRKMFATTSGKNIF